MDGFVRCFASIRTPGLEPRGRAGTVRDLDGAPSTPTPIDPLAGVCFAIHSPRSSPLVLDEGLARASLWVMVLLLVLPVLALGISAASLPAGPRAAPRPGAATLVLVLYLVVPIGVLILIRLRRSTRSPGTLLPIAPPEARIHVLAPRHALERHADLDSADFEPEYFRIWLLAPTDPVGLIVLVAAGLASYVGLQAIPWAAPPLVAIPLSLSLGFNAAMLAMAFLRQTYLRIAPGRLDVFRFSIWRETADFCRPLDLRNSGLVIDPARDRIVIEERQRHTVVSYLGASTPSRLSAFLLRAAISTAPTPDLPTDRLHD